MNKMMTPAVILLGIGIGWTIIIIVTVAVLGKEPSIPSCVIVGLGYGLGLPALWLWRGKYTNDDRALRIAGAASYLLTISISTTVAYVTAA